MGVMVDGSYAGYFSYDSGIDWSLGSAACEDQNRNGKENTRPLPVVAAQHRRPGPLPHDVHWNRNIQRLRSQAFAIVASLEAQLARQRRESRRGVRGNG